MNNEFTIKKLSSQEMFQSIAERPLQNYEQNYLVYFSSFFGGIVEDPRLMLVPMDDHMVHRGDGVFEVFKALNGNIWLLEEHIDRLERSAHALYLKLPYSRIELHEIINSVASLALKKSHDIIIRLYVGRGPGGFSPNPSECIGSQLYVVASKYKSYPEEKYLNGVVCGFSQIQQKSPLFATVKSCNYLQNVLMRKECITMGWDFSFSIDQDGSLAESATENVIILDKEGWLRFPRLTHILKGTSMMRLLTLAQKLINENATIEEIKKGTSIKGIREGLISQSDVFSAMEIIIVGTTLDAISVVKVEGQAIGNGKVGSLSLNLRALLKQDQLSGERLTSIR